LLIGTLTMWAKGSRGTTANQYACIALNKMTAEIEEGRSASIVDGKLVVVFPFYNSSTGDYDRNTAGNVISYYLSGDTGTESTGSNLWKSVENGAKTRLCKHIEKTEFNTDNPRTVQMTLKGVDREGGQVQPTTVRVTIKLRNS
jgi:hypothetical protein